MNTFQETLAFHNLELKREAPRVLQLNLGKRCNQTCSHCHVNAGPARKEEMSAATVERILGWLEQSPITVVDITGGAPELNLHFRQLVAQSRAMSPSRHVMDRCNLTILFEPGQESLAEFLAAHRVEVVASMPCYSPENVDAQRGDGVFDKSIRALQLLNSLGYGRKSELPLNLVYNPVGAFLPPKQQTLELLYKAELKTHFDIDFHHLYTITNMPISRFATYLHSSGQTRAYQDLLVQSFNPGAVAGLMCRDTLSVDWLGRVYDCDFNQMANLPLGGPLPKYLWDCDPAGFTNFPVSTAPHCFGCTAGAGSSCGGAIQ